MTDIVSLLRAYGSQLHNKAADEIERLQAELETEHVRLAACGVIALSNTPKSAINARQCKSEYWSASAEDVAKVVDSEMQLRQQVSNLQAQLEATQKACEVALSRQDEADQLYLQALAAIEVKDAALTACSEILAALPSLGFGGLAALENAQDALAIKPNNAVLLRHEAEVLQEVSSGWFTYIAVEELKEIINKKLATAEALECAV